jgi:hypothetical protein
MRLIRIFVLSLATAGMVMSTSSPASADPLDVVGAVVTSVAGPGVCC